MTMLSYANGKPTNVLKLANSRIKEYGLDKMIEMGDYLIILWTGCLEYSSEGMNKIQSTPEQSSCKHNIIDIKDITPLFLRGLHLYLLILQVKKLLGQ